MHTTTRCGAAELLRPFEEIQELHVTDRDWLQKELNELKE